MSTDQLQSVIKGEKIDEFINKIDEYEADIDTIIDCLMKHGSDPEVLNILGYIHETIKKDYEQAQKFYQQAISLNNTRAMLNLGYMHQKGIGVDQNKKEAKKYYQQAFMSGNTDGLNYLASMYYAKDKPRAIAMYERAIQSGNAHAMYNLARIYAGNVDLFGTRQPEKAIHLYQEAIKLGCTKSINGLASMYRDGREIPVNYDQAIEYYQQGIQLKNRGSLIGLAVTYKKMGNSRKAIKYYLKASSKSQWARKQCLKFIDLADLLDYCFEQKRKKKDYKNRVNELLYLPGGPGYFEAKAHFLNTLHS